MFFSLYGCLARGVALSLCCSVALLCWWCFVALLFCCLFLRRRGCWQHDVLCCVLCCALCCAVLRAVLCCAVLCVWQIEKKGKNTLAFMIILDDGGQPKPTK